MIIKEIENTINGGGKSSGGSGGGARSFGATIEYIEQSDAKLEDLEPAVKADLILMQNFNMMEPDIAAKQMKDTAKWNKKVADPCRHLVISWEPDDTPSAEQAREVVQTYLREAGYGEHQAIAYAHNDKDHFHIHIAVNRVHPITHNSISDKFERSKANYKIRERVAREFEVRYGWQRVEGKHYTADKDNNVVLTTIEQKRELMQARDNKISGKTMQVERGSGQQSFQRWCKESPDARKLRTELKALLSNKNTKWNDLHKTLDKYNLEIRPDKNKKGYIIVDKSSPDKLHVKASDLSRDISKGGLDKAVGQYESPALMLQGNKSAGYKATIDRVNHNNPVFEKYLDGKQHLKAGIVQLKQKYSYKETIGAINRRTTIKVNEVKKQIQQPKTYERTNLRTGKTTVYSREAQGSVRLSVQEGEKRIAQIRLEATQEKAGIMADFNKEKIDLETKFDSCRGDYKTYLAKEADKGQVEVMPELARVDSNHSAIKNNEIVIDSHQGETTPSKDVRNIEFEVHRKVIGNNHIIYRWEGSKKEIFIDKGETIKCVEHSREAITAMVQLAAEKHHGQIQIGAKSSEAFRAAVIDIAVKNGYTITNPELKPQVDHARMHKNDREHDKASREEDQVRGIER